MIIKLFDDKKTVFYYEKKISRLYGKREYYYMEKRDEKGRSFITFSRKGYFNFRFFKQ